MQQSLSEPNEDDSPAASVLLDATKARFVRMEQALRALDEATVSAIHENGEPNRVIFKDGFALEGRGADEWLRFMRLIQSTCRAALRGDELPVLSVDETDSGNEGPREMKR